MHAKIITFAAGALFVLGNAVPLNNNKRDLVWVTEIETAVETVPVTTTVWVDPTPSADQPKQNKHYGHRSQHHKQEQSSESTVEVKPTPSPEPSSEAAAPTEPAPAPSSYEAPPAPSSEAPSSSAPEPSSPAVVEQPATTSQPAAPTTTQAPSTPTSTYSAPASSSSAAAPSSYSSDDSSSGSSGSSSGNPASGESFTGELTYFTPGMGACGHTSSESEKMVAVSQSLFDKYTTGGNPNANPLCGKQLIIKGADGDDYKATIWDRCTGCAEADLDLPQEFFNTVTMKDGKPADGRAHGVEWTMD